MIKYRKNANNSVVIRIDDTAALVQMIQVRDIPNYNKAVVNLVTYSLTSITLDSFEIATQEDWTNKMAKLKNYEATLS